MPDTIRCLTCGESYTPRPETPAGNGEWQRNGAGQWWHWHGGYPGRWELCEEVKDGRSS